PRVTHPSAANRVRCKHLVCSLDLHVLGTPPAFVLSQDQTLHNRNVNPQRIALSTSFVRSVTYDCTRLPSLSRFLALHYVLPFLESVDMYRINNFVSFIRSVGHVLMYAPFFAQLLPRSATHLVASI